MTELKLTIKKLSRRHVCAVPGCRERETLFISRRNDVNGTPLYLCQRCIKDIYGEAAKMAKAKRGGKGVSAESEADDIETGKES